MSEALRCHTAVAWSWLIPTVLGRDAYLGALAAGNQTPEERHRLLIQSLRIADVAVQDLVEVVAVRSGLQLALNLRCSNSDRAAHCILCLHQRWLHSLVNGIDLFGDFRLHGGAR